jgi:hypothetical protein
MYLYYGEEYEVPKKEHFILRAAILLPVQDQPQVYRFHLCFYLYNNAKYAYPV